MGRRWRKARICRRKAVMKLSHLLVTALACVSIAACDGSKKDTSVEPGAYVEGTAYGVVSKGSPDAKAVLVEYASATCPHCADLHERVIKKLQPRIDAGELRLEFYEFLTDPANVAHASFKIARCAGADHYFDVLEDVFQNQQGIVIASQRRQLTPALFAVAQRHGLSKKDFETCLLDQKVHEAISANWYEGRKKGITSTPTLYLNGKEVDRAIYFDLDAMNAEIDKANGIEPKKEETEKTKTVDDQKTENTTE